MSRPFGWAAVLLVFAFVAAMAAPFGQIAAQTPSVADGSAADLAPATSIFFAEANLDTTSDQMVLASELIERAGLGNVLEESAADEEIPANTRIGVIVNSIPDVGNLDVAEAAVDPMEVTDTLDQGGFALVFTADNAQELYDQQLEDIQGDVELSGGELIESEYEGVTITSYQPAPGDEYTDAASVAMVGDWVVTSVRAEDIHPIIDTFNGPTPSLSTNERYQEVIDLLPSERISSGFLNGPALLEAAQASSPESLELADPRIIALLNGWSGYALAAEQDGFRLQTRSITAGDRFDDLTPLDGSFFDKVPSDALFAVNGTNIDSSGVLTMLAFFFASELIGNDILATPAADLDLTAAQEQVFAQAEQLLGFNLKTDLIDHLTGEFGISMSVGDITSPVPTVNALIVTTVDDPRAVISTIAKVSLIVGAGLGDQAAIGERDVAGSEINVIDISETGVADKVEFGVVGDELIVGVGTGLDDYVDGPENPMSEDPNFTAVMEQMPDEYGSATYVNMPAVIEIVMGFSASMESGMSIEDADPSCGDYASQEDAQTAYDADQFENFMLDQDFDGEACEDFFAAGGTPEATPTGSNPYPNVIGLASVTTQEDGVIGSDTFLMIGGE